MELISNGYKVSVWEALRVLERDGGDGSTNVNVLNTSALCTYMVKLVNFISCQFHYNYKKEEENRMKGP